jgi:SanA protein
VTRRVFIIVLVLFATPPVLLAISRALINQASNGRVYADALSIPHRRVGLILGCSKKLGGGWVNPFFQNRVTAAASLYRAGKVDYLLVSGDNHVHSYDEAKDMKDSLAELGVPREKIFCDYAGFRTLDSVVRAHEVFGQSQITVISQDFHNRRAIFLAQHEGMDAIGFNAADVDLHYSYATHCREEAAKIGAVLDVYIFHTRPKFLGPRVAIGPIPQPEPI